MATLTVRSLPEDVHARLRARAAEAQISVEGLVRRTLADAVAQQPKDRDMPSTGFAEACVPFIHEAANAAPGALPELWGALRGSVRIAPDIDLAASSGEPWSALA